MKWAQFSIQQEETLYACRDALMPRVYQDEPDVEWKQFKSRCGHTVFWASRHRQWETITNAGSMEIASFDNAKWNIVRRWEPLRVKRTREVHSLLDEMIDDAISISHTNAVAKAVERIRIKRVSSVFEKWTHMRRVAKVKMLRSFKAWKWGTNRDKKEHSKRGEYVKSTKRSVFHAWVMLHRSKLINELHKCPNLGKYLCKSPICVTGRMPQFVFHAPDAAPKSAERWRRQAHTAIKQRNAKVAELLLLTIPADIATALKDKPVYSKTQFPIQWMVEALERCCHCNQKQGSLRVMAGAVESPFILGVGDMGCTNGAYSGGDIQEQYPHCSLLSCGHSVSWFHSYERTGDRGCLVTRLPPEVESDYCLSTVDDDSVSYLMCRNSHGSCGSGAFVTPLAKKTRAIATRTFIVADGGRLLRFTKANAWAGGNNHRADIDVYTNNAPEPQAWRVAYSTADKRTLVWDARWWKVTAIPHNYLPQLHRQVSLKLHSIRPCCRDIMNVFVARNILTHLCESLLLFAYDSMGSISCGGDVQKHILCVDVSLMLLEHLKEVLEFSVFDSPGDVQRYYDFCCSQHKKPMMMILGCSSKLKEMGMQHVMDSHLGALVKLMMSYLTFGQVFFSVWRRMCDARGMIFAQSFPQCQEEMFSMSFVVRDGSCIGAVFPALHDDPASFWEIQQDLVEVLNAFSQKANITRNCREGIAHAFPAKRFRTRGSTDDFYGDVARTKVAYSSIVRKWCADGLAKNSALNTSVRMKRRKRK